MNALRAAIAGLWLLIAPAAWAYNDPLTYDPVDTNFKVNTATLAAASSTTLALIGSSGTTLSVALTAGKTYVCQGHLSISTGSSSAGAKAGLVATNSLTATSFSREILAYSTTTLSANSTTTSLDATSGGAGATASVTDILVSAVIVVNAAGTINLEGAQNVTSSTATTFNTNSFFWCRRTTS